MLSTAIKYLDAFEKKDISAIREVFDGNVNLRDWEVNASGIDSALAITAQKFSSAQTISIRIINISQSEDLVFVELDITINNNSPVHVVDVITFNSVGKICSIRGFRG